MSELVKNDPKLAQYFMFKFIENSAVFRSIVNFRNYLWNIFTTKIDHYDGKRSISTEMVNFRNFQKWYDNAHKWFFDENFEKNFTYHG